MHLPSNFMDSGEAAAGNSGLQALLVLKDVRRNAGPGRPTTTLSQPLLGSVHGLLTDMLAINPSSLTLLVCRTPQAPAPPSSKGHPGLISVGKLGFAML